MNRNGFGWHLEPERNAGFTAPRYYTACAKCGTEGLKRDMTTLLVKQGVYGTPRTFCHICPRCMPELLDELEVSMPE